MKKVLKRIGIGFLIFVAAMLVYAVLGLQQTLSLRIGPTDLTQLPDGEYGGKYDCYRWSNSVKVSVADHRIAEIAVIQGPQGREGIRRELVGRILQAQSPSVDAVSGATVDSKAFLKAVENALQSGR